MRWSEPAFLTEGTSQYKPPVLNLKPLSTWRETAEGAAEGGVWRASISRPGMFSLV